MENIHTDPAPQERIFIVLEYDFEQIDICQIRQLTGGDTIYAKYFNKPKD
jgi:hypothetical protein